MFLTKPVACNILHQDFSILRRKQALTQACMADGGTSRAAGLGAVEAILGASSSTGAAGEEVNVAFEESTQDKEKCMMVKTTDGDKFVAFAWATHR